MYYYSLENNKHQPTIFIIKLKNEYNIDLNVTLYNYNNIIFVVIIKTSNC